MNETQAAPMASIVFAAMIFANITLNAMAGVASSPAQTESARTAAEFDATCLANYDEKFCANFRLEERK